MKAAFSASLPKPFRKSYICVCAPKCPEVASLLSFEQMACMCNAPPPTPQSANNLARSMSLPNVTDSCKCSTKSEWHSAISDDDPCASQAVCSCGAKPKKKTPCRLPSMVSLKPSCKISKHAVARPMRPPMPLMRAKPPCQLPSKTFKTCPCCKQKVPEWFSTCGVSSRSTIKSVCAEKRNNDKSCTCGMECKSNYQSLYSEDKPCTCGTNYHSFISDEKSCTCGALSKTTYHSFDSDEDAEKICTCGAKPKRNYKSASRNKDKEKPCTSKAKSQPKSKGLCKVCSDIKLCTYGVVSKAIFKSIDDIGSCTCGALSQTNFASVCSEQDMDNSCTCGTLSKMYSENDDAKSCTCGAISRTNYTSICSDKDKDKSCTCRSLSKMYSEKDDAKSCTSGVLSKPNYTSICSDKDKDKSCTCGTLSKMYSEKDDAKSCTCGALSQTNYTSTCSDKDKDKSCTCGTLSKMYSDKGEDKSCVCGTVSKTNYKSIYSNKDDSSPCGTESKGNFKSVTDIPRPASKSILKSVCSDKDEYKSYTCGTASKTDYKSNKDDVCSDATGSKQKFKSVTDLKSVTCGPASKTILKSVCSDKEEDKSYPCRTASKTNYKSMLSNKDVSCPGGPASKVIWNSVCFEQMSCTSRAPSIANKSASAAKTRMLSVCSDVSGMSDTFKNCQGVETSFKEEKNASIYESVENLSTNSCIDKKATPSKVSDVCTSLHPEVQSFYICKENGSRKQSPFSIRKKSTYNDVRSSLTKKRKQSGSSCNPRKSKTRKSMLCSTRTSSRSQSVMAEVTCLCTSTDRAQLGATNRKGPPFARVQNSGLSVTPANPCMLALADERNPSASVIWKGDNYRDCISVSSDSDQEFDQKSNEGKQQKSKKSLVKMISSLPEPMAISSKITAPNVGGETDMPKDVAGGRHSAMRILNSLKPPRISQPCFKNNEAPTEMSCDCSRVEQSDVGCKCEPLDGYESEKIDSFKTDQGCTCKASISQCGHQLSVAKSCLSKSSKPTLNRIRSCVVSVSRSAIQHSVGKEVFRSCIFDGTAEPSYPSKATVLQPVNQRSVVMDAFKSFATNVKSVASWKSCCVCPMETNSLRNNKLNAECISKSQITCKSEPHLQLYDCASQEPCKSDPQVTCKSEAQVTYKSVSHLTCKSEPQLDYDCKPQVKCSEPQLDYDCKPQVKCSEPLLFCDCKPQVECSEPQFVCDCQPQVECKSEPKLDCDCKPQVECKSEPQLDCDCKPQVECKSEPKFDYDCKPQVECRTEPQYGSTNKGSCDCSAKQRIVDMLDIISDKCDTKTDRTVIVQKIIKELTDMLRKAEESADCTCLSVEECMEAVAHGRSPASEAKARKELPNQGLTKEYLDRMEKCLNDCFSSKKSGLGYEIVAFEFDPKLLAQRAADEAAEKAAREAAEQAAREAADKAAREAEAACACKNEENKQDLHEFIGDCDCGVQPIDSAVFLDCECHEEIDNYVSFECVQEPNIAPCPPCAEEPKNQPCPPSVKKPDSQTCPPSVKKPDSQTCPPCVKKPESQSCLPCVKPDNQVCLPCVEGCEKDFQDTCGPLTDRERQLCDYLICRMCQICQGQADQDECPGASNNTDAEKEAHQCCLCCHCLAMQCDNQCKTVKKVLDPIVCDPVDEMQYFVDSMICDLQAVDHVVNKNKLYPKTKPSKCMGSAPGDSFPVVITEVSSLGCRALYLRWELLDCAGVGGYEIYVDGHLTNRFYNYRHEAGVISNVDVTKPHQIILRTQAVGQEFPEDNDCCCPNAMVNAHPELLVGATEPWRPSVYMYEP